MKKIVLVLSVAVLTGLSGCASTDGNPGWNIPADEMFQDAMHDVTRVIIKVHCETTIDRWLEIARRAEGDNTSAVEGIRFCSEETGVSLEQAGTSEEELSRLLVIGYIAQAKRWIDIWRVSKPFSFEGEVNDCLTKARAMASSAGIKPEGADAVEAELKKLLAFDPRWI
jgi:hypothetical protein